MTGREEPPELSEQSWIDEEAGPVVRPYAVTRGRARPSRGQFDLITVVMSTEPAASGEGLGPEHVAIVALCQNPMSVAEVAAHLDLPVGVVRVLLGDLLDKRLIVAHEPLPAAQLPNEDFFEAVLNGLRAL
jgi:hypothetical protein